MQFFKISLIPFLSLLIFASSCSKKAEVVVDKTSIQEETKTTEETDTYNWRRSISP